MGLANRVVSPGNSLQSAIELARKIVKFLAECLKAGRLSTCREWNQNTADALANEATAAYSISLAEALPGARRFASELGRNANFKNT